MRAAAQALRPQVVHSRPVRYDSFTIKDKERADGARFDGVRDFLRLRQLAGAFLVVVWVLTPARQRKSLSGRAARCPIDSLSPPRCYRQCALRANCSKRACCDAPTPRTEPPGDMRLAVLQRASVEWLFSEDFFVWFAGRYAAVLPPNALCGRSAA
jgi:hypothetical protein